jgi:hypothetical protein
VWWWLSLKLSTPKPFRCSLIVEKAVERRRRPALKQLSCSLIGKKEFLSDSALSNSHTPLFTHSFPRTTRKSCYLELTHSTLPLHVSRTSYSLCLQLTLSHSSAPGQAASSVAIESRGVRPHQSALQSWRSEGDERGRAAVGSVLPGVAPSRRRCAPRRGGDDAFASHVALLVCSLLCSLSLSSSLLFWARRCCSLGVFCVAAANRRATHTDRRFCNTNHHRRATHTDTVIAEFATPTAPSQRNKQTTLPTPKTQRSVTSHMQT